MPAEDYINFIEDILNHVENNNIINLDLKLMPEITRRLMRYVIEDKELLSKRDVLVKIFYDSASAEIKETSSP